MGIARSTFYDRPERSADDTAVVEAMFAISDDFEFYGYRRVGAALRQQGIIVNHKKLRRLMREHDLQPRMRRRFVATTDSNHDGPIFPNVAAGLAPTGPDQLWVADITYIPVHAGFIYLAVVLDTWSRRVVGYARVSSWVVLLRRRVPWSSLKILRMEAKSAIGQVVGSLLVVRLCPVTRQISQ
jgi:putative transposase